MTLLRCLARFYREFSAIMEHARTGKRPCQRSQRALMRREE
jgi:hypothetical protein